MYQVKKGWDTWRGLGIVPRDSFMEMPEKKSHSSGAVDTVGTKMRLDRARGEGPAPVGPSSERC